MTSKANNQQSDALKEDTIQFQEFCNFEQSKIQSIDNNENENINNETEESLEMQGDVFSGSITKLK